MKALWIRSLLLVLAGALFFGAIGVVAVWAPDVPPDELKIRWARPPSRFLEVNGQQVHLRDEGPHDDPVPVVLLHGAWSSLHTWQGWADGLRDHRRVIRFDLPGFGLTGPNAQDDYSIERSVLFVRSVMDKLGVDRFVLGGNGLGGEIAWATAASLPGRVDRLILVNANGYPPASFGVRQDLPVALRVAQTPALRLLANYLMPRALVEHGLRQLHGDPAKVTPELVDRYTDMARRDGNRAAYARRLEQGSSADLALLSRIRAPALILWGGKDPLLPSELAQRFAREMAGARLVSFENLGHMPQEEDPLSTLAEVRLFLGL